MAPFKLMNGAIIEMLVGSWATLLSAAPASKVYHNLLLSISLVHRTTYRLCGQSGLQLLALLAVTEAPG